MIPPETLDQIKAATDIVSVVRDYVPALKNAGRNFKACCPFHNEKTPSFVVSAEKGIFRCFGCNASGDAFKFLMLIENITWIEAVKKLAQKAGIEIKETNALSPEKASEKTKLYELLELSAKFYHKCLKSARGAHARKYLSSRNVSADTIEKFMLGFAPRDMLIPAALKKGYTPEMLIKAGIMTKTQKGAHFEYMTERVVFPIFDVQGRVVAFGGRSLSDIQPKYLNSPESAVYSKSANLYGLYQTLPELRKERKMIILEGYMDVVITQQYGVSGAVASLGTSFTQQHAKLISRYSDNTILLFDSDNAGRTATKRALEILTENDIAATTSALTEKTDADEFLTEHGKDKFLAALKNSSKSPIDFIIARVQSASANPQTPQGKAKIVVDVLEFIAKSKNEVIQREWIKTLSQKVNVNEASVWTEFQRLSKFNVSKETIQNNFEKNLVLFFKSLTAEETLLSFIANEKAYIHKVDEKMFSSPRCKTIYGYLAEGLSEAEILNKLNAEDAAWFSSLTLEPIQYRIAEEAFSQLVKDLGVLHLKNRLKELENDIINIGSGKMPDNPEARKEYKKLIIILKGSGKE